MVPGVRSIGAPRECAVPSLLQLLTGEISRSYGDIKAFLSHRINMPLEALPLDRHPCRTPEREGVLKAMTARIAPARA
jgi:hypothetical protein